MTRKDIESNLLTIFRREFEINDPGMDDDLREVHEFDSIDAIELLGEIEKLLGFQLSQSEKKRAMEIRTLSQICDYVESISLARA